ncbi:putative C2H2 type zinc-finger-domain-containing protein [Seiridium cardinale]
MADFPSHYTQDAATNLSLDANNSNQNPGIHESPHHEDYIIGNQQSFLEAELSALSLEDKNEDERQPQVAFSPAQCLFCASSSAGLEANLEHMLQKHGLFIPDTSRLIVDLETLIKYFHLVIYGYFECLFCGSQRHSAEAARQHMTGKGHCKIDILREDSEFRDFYDFDSDDGSSENSDEEPAVPKEKPPKEKSVEIDNTLRLASGKLLSHRSQGVARLHRKPRQAQSQSLSSIEPSAEMPEKQGPEFESEPSTSATAESSKRIVKQEAIFRTQLASLRSEDRRSLMHLPLPQQRALVMKSKKQVEQARRDENEMQLKIQLKANKSNKK